MADWSMSRVGDLLHVEHGWPFKSEHYSLPDEASPIVLSIGNFDYGGGFRFGSTNLKGYSGIYPKEFECTPGDIMLVMTCQTEGGEILGVPGRIPNDGRIYLHNQRIGRVVIDRPKLLDAGYFYHYARTADFNRQLFVTASGSKILHTSPSRIADTVMPLPCLAEQRAIADVLSALDDKIAANTKIATTADRLARTKFDAAIKGVGFSSLTFADVAKIGGGGTPRSNVPEFWTGDVPWLTPTDVTSLKGPYARSTRRTISDAGLNSMSSKLYPSGSIFMTSRATIGAFAIAERPMAVNQGFIVVEPTSDEERFWLFHEMRSRVPEFLEHANGATFLELSRGNFKKLPVRWPEPGVIRSFAAGAGVLHDRASVALQESDRLIATRDALLPALMSGRLTVRDAESAVESVIDGAVEPDAAATGTPW